MPGLKITARDGYVRGQEGFEQILQAAHRILVESGSQALTMRRIAAECGLQPGHLAYYFKSKSDLIRELLNAVVGGYEDAFDAIAHRPGAPPAERLADLVDFTLEDITSKETTRIFPELWAMANHDPFVDERVDELYQRARASTNELVAELNPRLSVEERELVTLFISASMEGLTVFAGYRKRWQRHMPVFSKLATRSFIRLIADLAPGELGIA